MKVLVLGGTGQVALELARFDPARPAAPKADAKDTSKRFVPPKRPRA